MTASDVTRTPPPALTVAEALALLTQLRDAGHGEDALVLPYRPGFTAVGPAPTMPVVALQPGFDWNHGQVFVQPQREVGERSDDLLKRLARYENSVLGALMALRRGEYHGARIC